jgi:glycosyltransferase involved in cell wall biosynthesis
MENKKILLTMSGLHFHKDEGAKHRLNSFVDSYSEKGFQVTVLLFYSLASFKFLRKKQRYLNPNAKWILFPSFPVSYNPIITNISVFFKQMVFALITRVKKYSIIQSELSGIICKYKKRNDFLIVDFHGDSVSEIEFENNCQSDWFSRKTLKWQRLSLKIANHIIVVSQELKQQLEINTSYKINTYSIIPCGTDVEKFEKATPAKIGAKLNRKIVVGYSGGLQKWQNIEMIIDFVKGLMALNRDIYFLLCTNSDTNCIKDKLKELEESSYSVHALSSSEVPSFMKVLDAGFLIRDNIVLNRVSSPTKLAEYMAAGAVVVCTQYAGDYKRSINHKVEGFVLPDMQINEDGLKDLNKYLVEVKRKKTFYQRLCLDAAKEKSWHKEFDKFFKQVF